MPLHTAQWIGKEQQKQDLVKRRQSLRYTSSGIEVAMANGNVMKIPVTENNSDINISEEMNRSGVWKSLEGNSQQDLE